MPHSSKKRDRADDKSALSTHLEAGAIDTGSL